MTTGTALAFIFICVIGPFAIVGAIWLEQRIPDPQPQHMTIQPPEPAPPGEPTAQRSPGLAASISPGPAHYYDRHHR